MKKGKIRTADEQTGKQKESKQNCNTTRRMKEIMNEREREEENRKPTENKQKDKQTNY